MYFLYQGKTPDERLKLLRDSAVKTEQRNYARSLTQPEVDAEKGSYAQDGIDKRKLEAELENTVKDYRKRINNLKERMDGRLDKIQTCKMDVSGTLYLIPDYTSKRMMFYDAMGELIDSRDMLPNEMQGRLTFSGNTNGTVERELPNAEDQSQFTHDEDGWAKMKDADLKEKYGTTDIAVIRTMKAHNGEWLTPEKYADAVQKDNANKNKQEKPLSGPAKKYIQALRDNSFEGRPNAGIVHSLKAKGILDADGNLTKYGMEIDITEGE